MASKTLDVTIVGKDRASVVFEKVGASAKTVGESLDQAGKQGEQGFRRIGDAADKAEREVREIGESADKARVDFDALGAALLTIGAGLAAAGQSAMRQEQLIIGLRRAYGDAADEMLRFAQELDDITIFTDDDIMAGERFFATLRNNYGFTIEQIKEVAQITADLATASNVTYEDAANRVTAALRGEAEAAEYLGLTMNQQAIDRENVTLSMSNQEAALFRLNALRQQSAAYEGTAADVANSSIGTYRDLTDTLEDLSQSAGRVIGPMGSMIGGIGLGVSGVVQMAGGFRTLGTAIRTASVASRAFIASPLGLAITAVAGAVALASAAFGRHREDTEEAAQAYEDLQKAVKTTDDVIRNLNLNADFGLARRLQNDVADARAAMDQYASSLDYLNELSQKTFADISEGFLAFISTPLGDNVFQFAIDEGFIPDFQVDAILAGNQQAIESATPGLARAMAEYYSAFELSDSDRAAIEGAMQPLFDLYSNPNINIDRLDAEMTRLFEQFSTGELTVSELTVELESLFDDITVGADKFDILADSINGMTTAQREFNWALDDLRLDGQEDLAELLERNHHLYADLEGSQQLATGTAETYAAAQERINDAIRDGTVDGDKLNAYLAGQIGLLHRGEISYQQYAENVIWAADNLPEFAAANEDAAASILSVADAASIAQGVLVDLTDEVVGYSAAMEEVDRKQAEHQEQYWQQQQSRWEEERAQRRENRETERQEREEALAEQERQEREHNQTMLEIQQTYWDETRAQQQASRDEQKADHEARLAAARDFISTMREVSGLDSPLATLDMTSLSTDAMGFARNVQIGNDALSNTYRIVVENTNAMGQTVQATADWIDELAYAEDGWTRVHQLQADGFINEQQMNAVFEARTSILEDNAHVQNDILTMQALQAPLMADLVSQQRQYIHELSNQSAEQQLVALGWMDSTTAAQAYTVVTQAAAVATGEMGATGRAAFEDMVQGAIAANPVLEQMLTDIGLIARDHEGNLVFNYDGIEGANSEIKMLTESILLLVDVLDDGVINGSVSIDTLEAQQRVQDLSRELGLLDGQEANIGVTGDGSAAKNVMADVANQLLGLDGQTATTYQNGVPDDALGAISSVAQDLAGLDGSTATVTINAINNAGAAIGSVAAQLWALDGQSATVTTNYVTTYSTVGSPGVGPTAQHGGIPSYATGGVVVHAAEGNRPEIAHFANGGTAMLPFDGLYSLPPMTYISPSNSSSTYGGDTYEITIQVGGNVVGVEDLAAEVTPPIMEAIQRGMQRRQIAKGMVA